MLASATCGPLLIRFSWQPLQVLCQNSRIQEVLKMEEVFVVLRITRRGVYFSESWVTRQNLPFVQQLVAADRCRAAFCRCLRPSWGSWKFTTVFVFIWTKEKELEILSLFEQKKETKNIAETTWCLKVPWYFKGRWLKCWTELAILVKSFQGKGQILIVFWIDLLLCLVNQSW